MKNGHGGLSLNGIYFNVLAYRIERESAHKDYVTVSKKTIFSEGGAKAYKLTLKCIVEEKYAKAAVMLDEKIGKNIRHTFQISNKIKVKNAYLVRYVVSEVYDENMIECELEFMCSVNIVEVTD